MRLYQSARGRSCWCAVSAANFQCNTIPRFNGKYLGEYKPLS